MCPAEVHGALHIGKALQLGLERGDDFFKARTAAQRIPSRQQLKFSVTDAARWAHSNCKLRACPERSRICPIVPACQTLPRVACEAVSLVSLTAHAINLTTANAQMANKRTKCSPNFRPPRLIDHTTS
jgi:hypothetical protein